MELVSAICPACGKTIEVDPSEEVDFCKECGKPLAVKDAIKLYTEKIERDEAGCKPDEKVMEKFNAILAQDYDLAKRYLDDFIRKEYPKLDVSFFPKYDRNIYNIYSSVDKIETDFENLQAINPWIGEMYYSLLHPFVNACCKAVYDVNFTGELSFLKLRLMPIERKLDELISYIDAARRAKYEHRSDDEKKYQEKAISCWKSVWNDCIDRYKDLIGQEHDDEYIEYITDWLYRWGRQEKELSANYKMKYDDYIQYEFLYTNKLSGGFFTLGYQLGNFSLEKRKWREAEEIKRAKAAKKRAEAAKRRKEEEQKRKEEEGEAKAAAKAAAEKEAYEKELAFWRQYIELLKAGKAKDAKALLEKTKQPSETDEFTKFKKGLFGVKYTGDISSLNADALATLSLKK